MGFRFKRRIKTHSNSTVRTLIFPQSTGLADGTVNSSYAVSLVAEGGVAPYAFAAINTLPAGMAVLSGPALLSGVPSTTQISTFSIQVSDAAGSTARQSFRMQVISSGTTEPIALSIANSTNAPQGVVGSTYSLVINSTGGLPPYSSYVVTGGTVPGGLSMSTAGVFTGTPSTTGLSTFTVQVKDANGSSASQSFRLNVISSAAVASTGSHAYFESLLLDPDLYRAFSLRSQSTGVEPYYQGTIVPPSSVHIGTTNVWRYSWPSDPHPQAQDGVKLRMPPNSTVGENDSARAQLHFPVGVSSGPISLIWDFYYTSDFKDNIGGVDNHKEFNLCDGNSTSGTKIYIEERSRFQMANGSTYISKMDFRAYGQSIVSTRSDYTPGLQDHTPYTPTGQTAQPVESVYKRHSLWTRFFLEIDAKRPSSEFDEWDAISTTAMSTGLFFRRVSLWRADEAEDPVKVYYRVPWRIRDTFLGVLRYEFDTSNKPSSNGSITGMIGECVGYSRNLVMLRRLIDSDTSIFKRPAP